MEESVHYQHIPELSGLIVSDAHFQHFHFQPHFHLDYHIGFVTEGVLRQKINGHTLDLYPGILDIMPPGQVHDGAGLKNESYKLTTFRIPPQLMQDVILDSQNKTFIPELAPELITNFSLNQTFLQLRHSLKPENQASQLHKDSLWTTAISKLLLSAEGKQPKEIMYSIDKQQMKTIREYCEANLDTKITLNTLANLCGLSRFQFIRRFQKHTGMAPHAWLTCLRLEKACRQLISPKSLIADIATEVGFYDQSHFNKAFKMAYGVAPSEYR